MNANRNSNAPCEPNPAGAPFWTPAKTAVMRAEWKSGTSVRIIAGMLGCSRNAIIGKARRLQLPRHAGAVFDPDALKKPRVKKPKSRRRAPFRRARAQAVLVTQAASPPRLQPSAMTPVNAPDPLRIPFGDLERHHCRYSVSAESPHFFCGHKRWTKSPFCAFHHALCYEPRRPKSQPDAPRNNHWRKFVRPSVRAA